MSYTALAVSSILVVVILDLFVVRTRLLTRRIFWVSYAIIVFFQLLTNGVLTGFRIVRYDGDQIIGSSTPIDQPPPFLGDGRIAFAPVEDLMFGFSLVLLTLILWVFWGRRGVQQTPMAGPSRLPSSKKSKAKPSEMKPSEMKPSATKPSETKQSATKQSKKKQSS